MRSKLLLNNNSLNSEVVLFANLQARRKENRYETIHAGKNLKKYYSPSSENGLPNHLRKIESKKPNLHLVSFGYSIISHLSTFSNNI